MEKNQVESLKNTGFLCILSIQDALEVFSCLFYSDSETGNCLGKDRITGFPRESGDHNQEG